MARFAPPATTPFTSVMCAGANSSSAAVTQLSIAQHTQAPAMSSAPSRTSASAPPASTTDAATTAPVPAMTRGPRCSRNTTPAMIVVNTSSRLSRSDDVAGEDRAQAEGEEHRADRAAEETAVARRRPTASDRVALRQRPTGDREHGERGTDVEEPGERERREVVGELGRERCRHAEQDGGDRTPHRAPAHRNSLVATLLVTRCRTARG